MGFSLSNQFQSVQSGDLFLHACFKFVFLHYGQIQPPSIGFSLSDQFQSDPIWLIC